MKLDHEGVHDVTLAQTIPVYDYRPEVRSKPGRQFAEELLSTCKIVVSPRADR
jgi:hypothetical protein